MEVNGNMASVTVAPPLPEGSQVKAEIASEISGRVNGASSETHNVTIRPDGKTGYGAALVLYTDGVVEARSADGIFFGEERLIALLRSSVALEASRIASRIEEAVLNFQEHAPRDDIAALVLRASG